MEAPDIDHDEYEDLSAKKKHGKTTTEENYKCERHFWQSFLDTKELDEDVVKAHMFQPGLFRNFLSLIDMRNYIKQDNLSSAKHVERVGLMQKLLEGLGFASPMDAREKDFEEFLTSFRTNICEEPLFQNKKRINELWELRKSTTVNKEMDARQVLTWVNSLMGYFWTEGQEGEVYGEPGGPARCPGDRPTQERKREVLRGREQLAEAGEPGRRPLHRRGDRGDPDTEAGEAGG
jgi:hypothetical protein